jgi:hypothetical protein
MDFCGGAAAAMADRLGYSIGLRVNRTSRLGLLAPIAGQSPCTICPPSQRPRTPIRGRLPFGSLTPAVDNGNKPKLDLTVPGERKIVSAGASNISGWRPPAKPCECRSTAGARMDQTMRALVFTHRATRAISDGIFTGSRRRKVPDHQSGWGFH